MISEDYLSYIALSQHNYHNGFLAQSERAGEANSDNLIKAEMFYWLDFKPTCKFCFIFELQILIALYNVHIELGLIIHQTLVKQKIRSEAHKISCNETGNMIAVTRLIEPL